MLHEHWQESLLWIQGSHVRANTLDASIKKALLKLVQGLCSCYREQRDIAAMQLNQAVNPAAGHAYHNFDSLLLQQVADLMGSLPQ